MTSDDLEFAAVTPERWSDLARLFEGRGGPSYCWCMVWREMPSDERGDNDAKRAALECRISAGEPVGVLAYEAGAPVAWCSVAPRETFRPLGGEAYDDNAAVWAIVCFFAVRSLRGTGISRRLIEAACDVASEAGATVIKAYPVDPDSPSYGFMGRVPTFLDAGFEELGMAGTRRHVMRKWLDR